MLVGTNKGRESEARSTSFLHLVVTCSLMRYFPFPLPFPGITFRINYLYLGPCVRRNLARESNQDSIS